jgi:hypothetical protein
MVTLTVFANAFRAPPGWSMGRERSWNGFDVNCTQSAGTKSGGGGGGRHADFGTMASLIQINAPFGDNAAADADLC